MGDLFFGLVVVLMVGVVGWLAWLHGAVLRERDRRMDFERRIGEMATWFGRSSTAPQQIQPTVDYLRRAVRPATAPMRRDVLLSHVASQTVGDGARRVECSRTRLDDADRFDVFGVVDGLLRVRFTLVQDAWRLDTDELLAWDLFAVESCALALREGVELTKQVVLGPESLRAAYAGRRQEPVLPDGRAIELER